MKNKKILILASIVLTLLVIAIYLIISQPVSTLTDKLEKFSYQDTASIDRIFLADKEGKEVLLERTDNGWTVNKCYSVKKDAIKNLLETIYKVKIRAPIAKSAYATVVKNLSINSVKCEIYTKGNNKAVRVYYVGNPTPDHYGTYMLKEDSDIPFVTHIEGFRGFLTPRFQTDANEWRSNEVFNASIDEIEKLVVQHPRLKNKSFAFKRNKFGTFDLFDENLQIKFDYTDTFRVYQYLKLYAKINYENVINVQNENFIDSLKSLTPHHIYTLSTRNGATNSIKLFKKKAPEGALGYNGEPIVFDLDRLWGLTSEDEVLLVQYFVFDKIKYELSNFLDESQ